MENFKINSQENLVEKFNKTIKMLTLYGLMAVPAFSAAQEKTSPNEFKDINLMMLNQIKNNKSELVVTLTQDQDMGKYYKVLDDVKENLVLKENEKFISRNTAAGYTPEGGYTVTDVITTKFDDKSQKWINYEAHDVDKDGIPDYAYIEIYEEGKGFAVPEILKGVLDEKTHRINREDIISNLKGEQQKEALKVFDFTYNSIVELVSNTHDNRVHH